MFYGTIKINHDRGVSMGIWKIDGEPAIANIDGELIRININTEVTPETAERIRAHLAAAINDAKHGPRS
jgi:hypothetical protein